MSIKSTLPIVAAVLLGGAAAWLQGKWSERWHTFPELETYAKQLSRVPEKVGEWVSQGDQKNDARTMEVAGAVGDLARTYRNSKGEEVTIFLICGRPQDIRYHTPDRCYPAAGFEKAGAPIRTSIETSDGTDSEFLSNTYTKTDAGGVQSHQRVYWSFCSKGDWLAPEEEFKWTFGGTPAMYKIYVIVPVGDREQTSERSAAKDFARVFMPELKKALAPAYETAKPAAKEKESAPTATAPS